MIPLCEPCIQGNEMKYVKECIDTNWVSSAGKFVDQFEIAFAQYLNVTKAVATVNGTSALHLALILLGIGPGDEVIVPSLTFIAPVNAIRYVGAEPVFADVGSNSCVMDAERLEELVSERTRAILPVHLYGFPVAMEKVMQIAEKHNLFVIEDATESLGAVCHGKFAGTIGHIGCFSFNGNKLITTGGGGMLVTNDINLGQKAKYLSNQAKSVNENGGFIHSEIGYNYRLPNILAAFGLAQMENIHQFIKAKREHANQYTVHLKGLKGLNLFEENEGVQSAYWLYSAFLGPEFPVKRDELISCLLESGIETRPFFYPVHRMKPYSECRRSSMENTEYIADHGINFPSSVTLKEDDILYICNCLKKFYLD